MSQSSIESVSPYKEYASLGFVEVSTKQDVKAKVQKAKHVQKEWWAMGLEKRKEHIADLKRLFEQYGEEFATRTAKEMGMPIGLSHGIVAGAIKKLEWNLANAKEALSPKITYEDDKEINEIYYEPYGVMACIVAWNFPLQNFSLAVSQALLVGNTLVMKYSEEVPLFCKFLEKIVGESSLPDGVVSFVYGAGDVGGMLVDEDVDILSFTGSSETGKKLYLKAAEKFIPIVMELGGSSPGIVFEDALLDDKTIHKLFWDRFQNSAQFCDGMKRLIVHESRFDECVEKMVAFAKNCVIGDPLNKNTELGPLVAERQVVKLEGQVKDALDKGAKLMCGGKRPEGLAGSFYEPTILTNISFDMAVWQEEVFGPALPVVSFKTYEEAIKLANDTPYGLSAYLHTQDKSLALKAMLDIQSGGVSANHTHIYRGQNPFGGYKASGLGREGGIEGFHDVCQIKVISREK